MQVNRNMRKSVLKDKSAQSNAQPVLFHVNQLLSHLLLCDGTILLFLPRNRRKIELATIRCPIYLKSSAMQILFQSLSTTNRKNKPVDKQPVGRCWRERGRGGGGGPEERECGDTVGEGKAGGMSASFAQFITHFINPRPSNLCDKLD